MKKQCTFLLLLSVFILSSPLSQAGSSTDELTKAVAAIEARLSARVGIATFQPDTGRIWQYRGDERFPMMSTAKTLICARMLGDIDGGGLDPNASTLINGEMLVPWSPVTETKIGRRISVFDACEATMLTSDNTAANLVLAHIGGPKAVTRFIRLLGDTTTQLTRIEPDLNEATPSDVRDTTTPVAMVHSLNQIFFSSALNQGSRQQLKQWMMDNTVSEPLIRSVLPQGWHIADRSGAGGHGSRGITALLWQGEQTPTIVSIYLTESKLDLVQRNQAIAELAKLLFDTPEVLFTNQQ
ncbi:class A beta-lactamase [Motilimonas sp. 1_MG-2023]|uniref:class A beta-lactamase n=1 Tax=Motilimonas sp. 1_MG-2023 TaxID=3062672 RepID=UPI0026E1EB13|nr:class A beta-lactamase [Motilimonas sp. 1_MG-2023]MDO6525041.1 class A beta-lactamase [Motilimonas sp. 1_MG-2023]